LITFSCSHCGQRISVTQIHAGRKGKCPKCKQIVVIPQILPATPANPQEYFRASDDDYLADENTELRLKREPLIQAETGNKTYSDYSNVSGTHERYIKPDATEEQPVRKLPWLLDIFLYPTSMSGLINLGTFWILPVLFGLLARIFPVPCVYLLVNLAITAYMYYYFIECIRDSATGGIRAPENIANMPDLWEAISQMLNIVGMVIIIWGPVAGYYMYRILWLSGAADIDYDPRTDAIFWALLAYGVFFFPMSMIALAIFNSSSAFNPVVWVASIFSTFFQYCGLVLLFCGLGLLVPMITFHFRQFLLTALFFRAIFIYVAMVAAHLLGRFYYCNSAKLNWDA